MCFTAENIDYREYIMILMQGRRRLDLLPQTSIYLVYRRPSRHLSLRTTSKFLEANDLLITHRTSVNFENNEMSDSFYDSDGFVNFEGNGMESDDFTSRKYTEVFEQLKVKGSYSSNSNVSGKINKSSMSKESALTSDNDS